MRLGTLSPPRTGMAKKKPKATLFVNIDSDLKRRIDKSAEKNGRKLVAEVTRALEFYLAAHPLSSADAKPADEE